MAAESKQSQALRQLQEAFQSAQEQMARLRQQVERHAELSRARSQADFLQKEKERALRELGEAAWRLVRKGRLELPASLAPQLEALEQVERKAEAQSREIGDLLLEGEETAQRLKEKNAGRVHSGVAPRGRKL